jgi:hypothetical protein
VQEKKFRSICCETYNSSAKRKKRRGKHVKREVFIRDHSATSKYYTTGVSTLKALG